MAAVPSQGEALHKVKRRSDARNRRNAAGLRGELRSRYLAGAPSSRGPTISQLDWMERVIRYLSRARARPGGAVDRSIPQIAKALELPVEGLTARQVRDRFENQITRTLGYLELAGYVDRVERDLRNPDGSGRCIVIYLRAGVAQSVRAAEKGSEGRKMRRASCSSFGGQVAPPVGGIKGGPDYSPSTPTRKSQSAGRASAPSTRAGALSQSPALAALIVGLREGGGVDGASGASILESQPRLAELPLLVVIRQAWRALSGSDDGRLSPSMSLQLVRACGQLERTGYGVLPPGPAAPRAAAIDLALGDWRDHWHPRASSGRRPNSLGGLACCFRRLARRELRGWRIRRRRDA